MHSCGPSSAPCATNNFASCMSFAWLLYCGSPRSNYALRMVPPALTDLFAVEDDAAVQRCFSAMLFGDYGGAPGRSPNLPSAMVDADTQSGGRQEGPSGTCMVS